MRDPEAQAEKRTRLAERRDERKRRERERWDTGNADMLAACEALLRDAGVRA